MVAVEVYINRQLSELIDSVENDPHFSDSPHLQDLVKALIKVVDDFNHMHATSDEDSYSM